MNTKVRIATAVAAGYLLGRTKHLKLAIMVGGLIAGQKIPTNARDLSAELQKLIDGNEQLAHMSEQVRGELTNAARAAAVQVATDRLGRVSDNLRQVGGLPIDEAEAEEEAEEEAAAPEAPARQPSAKKAAKKTSGATKKATKSASGTARKTAKKAPAKKATKSASVTAKKTAKKAPAKKATKRAASGTAKKTSSASRTRKRS